MAATAPWIDTQAPAQFVTAPVASYGSAVMTNTAQTFDTDVNKYLGGGIILALLLIFGLQWGGFRFVVAASAGRTK